MMTEEDKANAYQPTIDDVVDIVGATMIVR
jgi:hypothetical protein